MTDQNNSHDPDDQARRPRDEASGAEYAASDAPAASQHEAGQDAAGFDTGASAYTPPAPVADSSGQAGGSSTWGSGGDSSGGQERTDDIAASFGEQPSAQPNSFGQGSQSTSGQLNSASSEAPAHGSADTSPNGGSEQPSYGGAQPPSFGGSEQSQYGSQQSSYGSPDASSSGDEQSSPYARPDASSSGNEQSSPYARPDASSSGNQQSPYGTESRSSYGGQQQGSSAQQPAYGGGQQESYGSQQPAYGGGQQPSYGGSSQSSQPSAQYAAVGAPSPNNPAGGPSGGLYSAGGAQFASAEQSGKKFKGITIWAFVLVGLGVIGTLIYGTGLLLSAVGSLLGFLALKKNPEAKPWPLILGIVGAASAVLSLILTIVNFQIALQWLEYIGSMS